MIASLLLRNKITQNIKTSYNTMQHSLCTLHRWQVAEQKL